MFSVSRLKKFTITINKGGGEDTSLFKTYFDQRAEEITVKTSNYEVRPYPVTLLLDHRRTYDSTRRIPS